MTTQELEAMFHADRNAWDGYDQRHDRIVCRTEEMHAEWAKAAGTVAGRKLTKK